MSYKSVTLVKISHDFKQVKLGDFGYARNIGRSTLGKRGTFQGRYNI